MVTPKGWESRSIGDFLEFKNGLNKGKEYFGYGIPIVNYIDVYHHRGLHAGDIQGRVSLEREEIRRFAVRKGDVFFTRTSETPDEVGISSVLLDDLPDGVFSGFVLRGRPKNDQLDIRYSMYCFSTKAVREAIIRSCTYTTRALTNGNVLSRINILVPNTREQRAIADQIGDLDELIASLDSTLAKQRDVRKGVAQQLSTGSLRLPSFHDEWFRVRLASLGSFQKGSGISRADAGTGTIPCIRYGEIYTTYDDYAFAAVTGISREVAEQATRINAGNIVFACTGETKEDIGKCVAYLSQRTAYAGGDTQVFSPNPGIDPVFLSSLLNASDAQRQKAALGQGDAVVHISEESLKAIELRLPCVHEQEAIAKALTDIDSEIDATERKLEKYKQIRQGMMRELLTGHIRLVQE